jgi:hypothetical protein
MLARLQKKLSKVVTPLVQLPSEIHYRQQLAQHMLHLPQLSSADQEALDCCNRDGVYVTTLEALGLKSSAAMMQAARQYLEQMEQIRPKQSLDPTHPEQTTLHPQIYTMTDLSAFTNWGKEPRLLNIIENYIGLPIAFQGVHLRRDFANPSPITTELWHQDLEDRRMLKAIIYLTDVEETDGPFEYIPKSAVSPQAAWQIHRQIDRAHAMGISDQIMETLVPRPAWRRCVGKAGTVVFMDPKNIFHHGKSRLKERAALFYVYTAAQPLHPEHCTQYRDSTFARPNS